MLHLVYRNPYEGPSGKRVRRVDAPSLLAWFQRGWGASVADPGWAEAQLGPIYGLASIFEAAARERLPVPQSWQELHAYLRAHLYVEGELRMDAHSLRVLTDDDELDLAYLLFDDELARRSIDRCAYLLHEPWRLPDGEASGGWAAPEDVAIESLGGVGAGQGCCYAVLLTYYDSDSLPPDRGPCRFEGIDLPGLAAHLLACTPVEGEGAGARSWPPGLRVLRGSIAGDAPDLEAGLRAVAGFPLMAFGAGATATLACGSAEAARADLERFADEVGPGPGEPERSRIHVGRHVAQLCMHLGEGLGHHQWVLFDERWAAAHPALAASLLRANASWDPFAPPSAGGTGVARVVAEAGAEAGPERHALTELTLPEPRAASGALAELWAAAQGHAAARLADHRALLGAEATLRGLAGSRVQLEVDSGEVDEQLPPLWLEGAAMIPAARARVTGTDLVRAWVQCCPERLPLPLPRLTVVPADDELPLCGAVARRWALAGGALDLDSLTRALHSELVLGLCGFWPDYAAGLLDRGEAIAAVSEELGPGVAPPKPALVDRGGGLTALERALAGPGPVWLSGPGAATLGSAVDGGERLRCGPPPSDAFEGAWIELGPWTSAEVIEVGLAHALVIADRWRVDWGLAELLACVEIELRGASTPAATALASPSRLIAAMHRGAAALAGVIDPVVLRVREGGDPEDPCQLETILAGPSSAAGLSAAARRWRRRLASQRPKHPLLRLLPDLAGLRAMARRLRVDGSQG